MHNSGTILPREREPVARMSEATSGTAVPAYRFAHAGYDTESHPALWSSGGALRIMCDREALDIPPRTGSNPPAKQSVRSAYRAGHITKSNGRPRAKTGAEGNKREYFHDHFTS